MNGRNVIIKSAGVPCAMSKKPSRLSGRRSTRLNLGFMTGGASAADQSESSSIEVREQSASDFLGGVFPGGLLESCGAVLIRHRSGSRSRTRWLRCGCYTGTKMPAGFDFTSLGGLIGMFSQQSVLKLVEVATTLLICPKEGQDVEPQS